MKNTFPHSSITILNLKKIGFSAISTVEKGVHIVTHGIGDTFSAVKELKQLKKDYNDLVIKLEEWNKDKEYDRLGLEEEYTEYLGNKVVCHSIPIRPGRNLAIICESAAVNFRQKKMGYNAAQELYSRFQNSLKTREEEE